MEEDAGSGACPLVPKVMLAPGLPSSSLQGPSRSMAAAQGGDQEKGWLDGIGLEKLAASDEAAAGGAVERVQLGPLPRMTSQSWLPAGLELSTSHRRHTAQLEAWGGGGAPEVEMNPPLPY